MPLPGGKVNLAAMVRPDVGSSRIPERIDRVVKSSQAVNRHGRTSLQGSKEPPSLTVRSSTPIPRIPTSRTSYINTKGPDDGALSIGSSYVQF